MKKQTALSHIFVILGLLTGLHLLVLSGVIPYEFIWEGNLKSVEEMRVLEITSLLIISSMLVTFIVKSRQLKRGKNSKGVNYMIWGIALSLFASMIGNLLAENIWEIVPGTTVTMYATYLSISIAWNDKSERAMADVKN